jgi:hypothetical protein
VGRLQGLFTVAAIEMEKDLELVDLPLGLSILSKSVAPKGTIFFKLNLVTWKKEAALPPKPLNYLLSCMF